MLSIGKIVKPQGIKGEVKVYPMTSRVSRFFELREVFCGGKEYGIKAVRENGGFVYLALLGVEDRNAAERLTGLELEIKRENAEELPEGEYYIVDLIGTELFGTDGVSIGKIICVDQFGAADVITAADGGGKIFRFPFLNRLNMTVDTALKKGVIDRALLDEVIVYED